MLDLYQMKNNKFTKYESQVNISQTLQLLVDILNVIASEK